jgi:hypothetical protein
MKKLVLVVAILLVAGNVFAGGGKSCNREVNTVELTGSGFSDITVFFGDNAVPGEIRYLGQTGVGTNAVEVVTPAAKQAGKVDVRVRSRAGERVLRSAFTYTGTSTTDSPPPAQSPPTKSPPTTSPPPPDRQSPPPPDGPQPDGPSPAEPS